MSTLTFPPVAIDDRPHPGPPEHVAPPGRRLQRLVRGRPTDPVWVRPALLALLASTALLYLWDLGASGWANSFYSAAVQAGTKSWKAFFFGSFDAANSITVDKPPASLWVMDLSARIFGVNSWSILVPQALEGVAAVGFLYAAVRRWFSPAAGLLAGAVLATTPVAALMFRFNNPDALLVLLLTVAAYATVRALESGRTKWLVIAAGLVGTGFITKMMQAFVVVPVFAGVYLLAGPHTIGRRIRQLLAAGVALLVASGWWVAAVELTPASARPYIGGSQNNSLLNLIFGYNGFGRLTGNETGSVGGGGPGGNGGSMWGPTGWNRLFNSQFGGEASWLIPAALVLMVAGLWQARRAGRTDRLRAALLLWGGWLLVTGVTFSFASGIIHPYYTVALAPAIGGLVGIGATSLWQHRDALVPRLFLAAALASAAVWSFVLLDRTPTWLPGLRTFVLVGGLVAAAAIAVTPGLRGRLALALAGAGIVTALAGPTAYAIDTATTPHSGAIPSAGPSGQGGGFGPGGRGGPGGFGGGTRGGFGGGTPGTAGGLAGGPPAGGFGRLPGGTTNGTGTQGGPGGGAGGLLDGSSPGAALTALLKTNGSSYTWVAAAVGANSAAGYQLATGDPVMAIGGFNGTDPSPTLAQFEADVATKKIHYFIGGGARGGLGGGGSSGSSAIASWVSANFTAKTVDGVTIYDLTSPASGTTTGTT
jgi:4-amino-4-deoxy-L-arabinose transferase-like glycosyltransferase